MKRMVAIAIAMTIAVTAVWTIPAQATDQLVPGKILIVKPGKLAKVIAKPISPAVFALPAPGNSPIVKPWFIWFRWFNFWFHFSLSPVQWKGLGNPPGSKGYKYKG